MAGKVTPFPDQRSAFRREVGRLIRERRLEVGYSQEHVARSAGMTQAALSNYERGVRDISLVGFCGVLTVLGLHGFDIPGEHFQEAA